MDGAFVHVGFRFHRPLAGFPSLFLDDPVVVAAQHLRNLGEVVSRRRRGNGPFDSGGIPRVMTGVGPALGTSQEIDDEDDERDE